MNLRLVATAFAIGAMSGVFTPPAIAAQSASWPAPRARHHLVYDSAIKQVFLIGGAQRVQAGASRDTAMWSWDGATWRSRPNAASDRANDATAFDASRRKIVVSSGSGRAINAELDDTWEWDQRGWQRINTTGPGARAHHAMVYDPIRKNMILFGNSDNAVANDTWSWDGSSWKLVSSEGPPRRGVLALTFDTKRGVAVMFGGYGSRSTMLNDTWEWDGQRWKQIVTPNSPSPRYDSQMAYDTARDRVVLYGGRGSAGNLGDTWEYDGRTWTMVSVAAPSARNSHAMVYDARAQKILLFGGRAEPDYFNDMWTYDGAWKQVPRQ